MKSTAVATAIPLSTHQLLPPAEEEVEADLEAEVDALPPSPLLIIPPNPWLVVLVEPVVDDATAAARVDEVPPATITVAPAELVVRAITVVEEPLPAVMEPPTERVCPLMTNSDLEFAVIVWLWILITAATAVEDTTVGSAEVLPSTTSCVFPLLVCSTIVWALVPDPTVTVDPGVSVWLPIW
jgi:hypothetical protein